jgi:hypothetical protein
MGEVKSEAVRMPNRTVKCEGGRHSLVCILTPLIKNKSALTYIPNPTVKVKREAKAGAISEAVHSLLLASMMGRVKDRIKIVAALSLSRKMSQGR